MSDIRQRARQAAAKRTQQLKKVEPVKPEVVLNKTSETVVPKATVQPVKRRISRWWRVFLVLLLIMTAAGIVNTVQRVQQIDAKVEADTAWIGLGAYCGRVLRWETNISDCTAWREWIERDYRAEVIDCNTRHPWLYEDINFYNCLTDSRIPLS